MRADDTAHLITAAQRRHELTRAKAVRALRELDQPGSTNTFEAVARKAEVSRSWLYTQPDIKDQIQQLRGLGERTSNAPIPSRQRSSDSCPLHRLAIANKRNQDLAEGNQRLWRQLDQALGQLRANRQTNTTKSSPNPSTRHSSVTIGPLLKCRRRPRAATLTTPSLTQTRRPQP
ncbi:DUF6262 family protein [Saccharomonospora sp. CUA-673]|uniref:DUF6262 family protein n=1 Tax=Saccharomonospora sp. CUA-673 TaxID=1904969 RepID=UPI00096A4A29|nr:DUF6262 family protein [Saccharomonospora sp. CUA-673]